MSYRGGAMPPDAGIPGCEFIQTCNRGFYGKDATGAEKPDIVPNWTKDVAATIAAIDITKPVYFDLEAWLANPLNANPINPVDVLTQKLYAATVLSMYRKRNPTGLVTLYGYPNQNYNPLNPAAMTDAWKGVATKGLNGGEISDLINANIDAYGLSFYPSEYTGKDDPMGSFPTQVKYNQLSLDIARANNPRNLPIYGWFQPAMVYRGDGKRHFLDYKTTMANVSWILSNCDGLVLWFWDGYGDPDKNLAIAPWDTNMPWYQAVKDCVAVANAAPNYGNTVNNFINKFPTSFAAA